MNNANEPAYPVQGVMYGDKIGGQLAHGMTKREAFAMAVMQGLLAYPGSVLSGSYHTNATPKDVAQSAVTYADALIEALKETP